jgi:N-acetylglutamate synthase-like GNAT family acetyltransferase
MEIRKSNVNDIPAIVELLKRSLGEQSSPKTVEYWLWKHVKNPFGESPVLVAEENGILIGVRAMLQWQWKIGNHNLGALRAVDTATDPAHQGKGIFSILTKQMIKDAKDGEHQFIFNTPNEKSKPGYIKMGWSEVGKLTVGISLILPKFFGNKQIEKYKVSDTELSDLCSNWNAYLSTTGKLYTPKSVEYLKWRYTENPVIGYQIFQTKNIYLALYVKKRKWGKEIRISELIYANNIPGIKNEVLRILKNQLRINKAFLVSYSPVVARNLKGILSYSGKLGPILTVKPIVLQKEANNFLSNVEEWNYLLGDMELF